ncbi:MAG: ABC transporter permease [Clostridium sp.]
MNLMTMLEKEFKEIVKSYKIIWVPVAFILINIMNPILFKMLPQLTKTSTNLPAGTVIEIPEPQTNDILLGLFSSFSQLGILIIALIIMGSIAGERHQGVTSMVLVKPITRKSYFFSKFIAYSTLIIGSFILSSFVSAYYTNVLYGGVNFLDILNGTLLYSIYLLVVISIAFFFSSFIKSQVGVAGATIATHMVLTTVPQYISHSINVISPSSLMNYCGKLLIGDSPEILGAMIFALVLLIAFLIGGFNLFKRQEV